MGVLKMSQFKTCFFVYGGQMHFYDRDQNKLEQKGMTLYPDFSYSLPSQSKGEEETENE